MSAMILRVMHFDYSFFKTGLLAALMPPVPFLALAAWGGWRLRRGRWGGGWLTALALIALWLSTTEAAGELLSRAAGQPAPLSSTVMASLQGRTDGAVLVLGAGVRQVVPGFSGGRPTDLTSERLSYGVWLARRIGWPLGFSGGIGWTAKELKVPEAAVVAQVAAQDYQMPLRWAEGRSRDTRENAINTIPLLAQAGVKQVVLVTHEAHMRRALRAFEAEASRFGMRVLPAPVGLREDALTAFSDWCPSVPGFARVRYVIYETLAWWAGR
ncbi:YdcF family protein [Roseateles puraquae]|jgi:uncharacterized SAM-binding protein YcdF (DUF218 family)|uniref:YdcF family protein n=1 Tax=Roseateles puraquae TaxID=431059 RepID=UPI0031E3F622